MNRRRSFDLLRMRVQRVAGALGRDALVIAACTLVIYGFIEAVTAVAVAHMIARLAGG